MRKTQKLCGIVLVTYVVLAVLFRVCAGASFSDGLVTGSQMVTERAVVGEILPDAPVTQTLFRTRWNLLCALPMGRWRQRPSWKPPAFRTEVSGPRSLRIASRCRRANS